MGAAMPSSRNIVRRVGVRRVFGAKRRLRKNAVILSLSKNL
jgi:hypothetical protein